jgi:FlaA1/EpsC-like NDP-sugar epimerase
VLLGVVAIYILTFVLLRVPQSMWRFAGFGEVKRLTIACAAAGLAAGLAVRGLDLDKVPRAVLALHPVVTLMGVILVRILYRMVYEHARTRITGGNAEIRRAIVLGAGDAARRLLAGIHQQGWIVLGLLDDDPALVGVRLAGVPVLGPLAAMASPEVIGGAKYLILAMPEAPASRRREVLALAAQTGLAVLTVPGEEELREGVQAQRVREIRPEDLLGRAPVELDEAGVAATLAGKAVMITGAGGSIGSELCRQVARFGPARLVLFEASEFNLYSVEQSWAPRSALELVRLLGDEAAHLAEVFALAPAGGLSCGGLQARAARRARQRVGGAAEQPGRQLAGRPGRGARRCRALRADQHRQGGQPGQRDGRDQARRRDGRQRPR